MALTMKNLKVLFNLSKNLKERKRKGKLYNLFQEKLMRGE